MKECLRCNKTKPLSKFSKDRTRKDGLAKWCKSCVKKYQRGYNKRNKESVAFKARESHLKRTYDMTLSEYDEMLAGQGGRCALCGIDTPGVPGAHFQVDHDHETGEVRGLLCIICNTRLGWYESNKSLFAKFQEYLGETRL